jgi:hypothetical protein
MTEHYELPRDGEALLSFDGVELATIDTKSQGKPSWTEMTVFRTNGGSYVVQTVARTDRADWHEWFSATIYESATEALKCIWPRGKYSKPAFTLLDRAAEHDDAIRDALDDIENQVETID